MKINIRRNFRKDDEAPFCKGCEERVPPIHNYTGELPNIINMDKVTLEKETTDFKYHITDDFKRRDSKRREVCYNYFFLSLTLSFIIGLVIGILIISSTKKIPEDITEQIKERIVLNSVKDNDLERDFSSVSFTGPNKVLKYKKDIYPKGMTEDMKEILKDNKKKPKLVLNDTFTQNDKTVVYENVYWGLEVENALPVGYDSKAAIIWEKYIEQAEVVKMESGCGRMQNRLVTFKDGLQACVRYRQNTDQIQGEIFSYYVGRVLGINNLAPSVVKVVDLKDKLWKNVVNDIGAAQWNVNRAVVLTQYIPSLESANIPDVFKPTNRHLNKYDILDMSQKENDTNHKFLDKLKLKKVEKVQPKFDHLDLVLNGKVLSQFVELAQWSDLIVFDYLTANLDRIVNNLFNFQWNINIMDGPAHNLARKIDNGLLLFLDNESGLLHGYRLLKKYNVYHGLMLENLCVFRKSTIDALKTVFLSKNVGTVLSDMFHKKNNAVIRDILPPLPEKNAKILHERIGKILSQVEKCEQKFASR